MNINDDVTVRLTEEGKNIYDASVYGIYQHEYVITIPLWKLMHIFGKYIHNTHVFEGNEIKM